jgi:hypothetical protein
MSRSLPNSRRSQLLASLRSRRGLQRLSLTLAGHVVLCSKPQFGVDERRQFIKRLLVSSTPGVEEAGYLMVR